MAAPRSVRLSPTVAHDPYLSGVTAGRYFVETRAHGAPPFYSPERIASSSLAQRQGADGVLAASYGIAARTTTAGHPGSPCVPLEVGVAGGTPLALRTGGTLVRNASHVPLVIGVSHFAPSQRPMYIAFLAGLGTTRVVIPAASAHIQWRLSLTTGGRAVNAVAAACPA